jgi:hypothetical protein
MKYHEVCPHTGGTNQTIKSLSKGVALKLKKQSVLRFFFIDIFATELGEKVGFAVFKRLLRCCYEH